MIGERERERCYRKGRRCYRKGWDVGRGRGAIGRVGMIGERERCYRKGWDDRGEGEVL